MRRARHVIRMGEIRNAYKIVVGTSEGKRSRGRPRRRRENSIKVIVDK
jgi:hypothetical protein